MPGSRNLAVATTSIRCPNCASRNVPDKREILDGVYFGSCPKCLHQYKFKAIPTPKSTVTFNIDGKSYTANSQTDVSMKLNEFIRDVAGLRDTKLMCYEGYCGSCIVVATFLDPLTRRSQTMAINSCLCPVYSCDGWDIVTPAGIGNKRSGFHVLQEKLAEHNGSQCGYCSPGMVMNMYGFLHENPKPSPQQIEDAFDGNICRCTGYRSILDAMQTFAVSAGDIEDIASSSCKDHCASNLCRKQCSPTESVHMVFSTSQWYKPSSLQEVLQLLQQHASKKVAFVVGGTNFSYGNDVYIDLKGVQELYQVDMTSTPVSFGANTTVAQLIILLDQLKGRSYYAYCADLTKHLSKVATRTVRNVASVGGNLMWKHEDHFFPSDVFLLLETVDARITVTKSDATSSVCSPQELLGLDMNHRILTKITLPPQQADDVVKTYKVMLRNQGSLAAVNAGFHMKIDQASGCKVIGMPAIVFGGISAEMIHSRKTEQFLVGKSLLDPTVLKGAFGILSGELQPTFIPSEPSPAYRKNLAMALFYKFVLSTCGSHIAERLRSGALPLYRPVSSGTEDYDTDQSKWPLTQALPKETSKLQAAGEALYINDIPDFPGQLHAEFVVTTQGSAKIESIDASAALRMPGVVRFITASDIPKGGVNNFMPSYCQPEEVFCSGQVLYAGQAVGLIIADTKGHAIAAAAAVRVTYTDVQPPILTTEEGIQKQSFFPKPCDDIVVGDAESAIAQSANKISGQIAIGDQYHFHMETQSCICVPKEDGLDLYPTSQWIDLSQQAVAMVLGIPANTINIEVKRLGGAYGAKITRNFPVGAAAALAAYITNKPVKINMTLGSNMKMLGKRVPYLARYEVGVSQEGMLNGVKITYYQNCGCSPNDGAITVAMMNGDNAYHCDNWHMSGVSVKTNLPCTTSMRAPGWMPGIVIMENIMEHVAKQLKMDPTGFKKQNLVKKGQPTPGGQVLTYCNISQLMEDLITSAQVSSRMGSIAAFNKMNRWKKKGLSVVPMKYGIGWSGADYNVFVTVYHIDGTIAISHGGIECGQGINTKVMQVCAYELGIPISMIAVKPSSSFVNSNSNTTGGSVTSELCCKGVIECCSILKQRMAPVRAKMQDPSWVQLVQRCFSEGVDLSARYWVYPPGQPSWVYQSYGVTCTEVELDVLTGENQINRVDILFDCGESMNPAIDIGQVQGAFVMGLGYFMLEKSRYDPQTGENVSATTWVYKPPMSKDIPIDFRIKLLKDAPNPLGILRSKAVGEPPLCMSCSAWFALKHAVEAARQEIGQDVYFEMDAPATVESAQMCCLLDPSQFILQ